MVFDRRYVRISSRNDKGNNPFNYKNMLDDAGTHVRGGTCGDFTMPLECTLPDRGSAFLDVKHISGACPHVCDFGVIREGANLEVNHIAWGNALTSFVGSIALTGYGALSVDGEIVKNIDLGDLNLATDPKDDDPMHFKDALIGLVYVASTRTVTWKINGKEVYSHELPAGKWCFAVGGMGNSEFAIVKAGADDV